MLHRSFALFSCAAVACLLSIPSVSADDPTSQSSQKSDQGKAADQWIKDLSSKVQLSDDQKGQIREKLSANSDKISSAWQKFSDANARAIALEATLYAAMEDGMSDQQKQQFRQNRDEQKKHQNMSGKDQHAGSKASDKHSSQQKTRQATAKANQSDEQADVKTAKKNNKSKSDPKSANGKNSTQTARNESSSKDSEYYYVTEMIIVPVQTAVADLSMDERQRNQCDMACQTYHVKLQEAWSDVNRFHDELVQLETQKLRSVESVLSEGQLEKLKSDRKSD